MLIKNKNIVFVENKQQMNKKIALLIGMLISLIAGLSLLLYPENVHPLIIRVVGIIWIIESGEYILKLITLYLNNK